MDEKTSLALRAAHGEFLQVQDRMQQLRSERDWMIADLVRHGEASRYEIAKALGMAESTVGRIVTACEARQQFTSTRYGVTK